MCRSGIYKSSVYDVPAVFRDETFAALFGEEDALAEYHLHRIKVSHPEVNKEYAKQEIGAFVQCIGRKNGAPYAMVSFEVLNRNRKWSDSDSEMLILIGSCIARLLCKEED